MTPCDANTSANTIESGQQHVHGRARDVHPEVADRPQRVPSPVRVSPRTSAIAIAMPAAAEMKLCQARPAIWVR